MNFCFSNIKRIKNVLDTWGGTGLYFGQILNSQGIVVDVKKREFDVIFRK